VSETVQARAVGFAEGYFTADRIYHFWTNYRHAHTTPHPNLLRLATVSSKRPLKLASGL
jgi:hypothetical protein